MTETELFSFETTSNNLSTMLQWASAPLDTDKYDKVYLNVKDDGATTISNAGEAVMSYCTFDKPFVQNVEVIDDFEDSGAQAILDVPQMEDYIDFVGGERLNLTFFGSESDGRSNRMLIEGELSANIYLDNSNRDYENFQLGIVHLYDDEDVFRKKSDNEELSTSFTTRVSEFEKIVDVTDFDSFALSNYPVVVKDESFILDASDKNDRDSVSGTLYADDVQGPDVDNHYSRGFAELFKSINGELDVSLEQDSVISIVRQSNDEALTCRYALLPAV